MRSKNKKREIVALIGASGNLGQALKRNLEGFDFEVLPIFRPETPNAKFFCIPYQTIITSGIKPNLIINASNFYSPSASVENINRMHDSIVGVAKSIANANVEWRVPVVSFSSYFQFAPLNSKPWSIYSQLKDEAFALLAESSTSLKQNHWDFMLYDTYGGIYRGKFLDKLSDIIRFSGAMDATLGEQEINLTHIEDIARNVASLLRMYFDGSLISSTRRFQIKHPITYSLKSLACLAEVTLGRRLPINWGVIPYREKEVFKLWEVDLPMFEGFTHRYELNEYFASLKN